ERSRWRVGQPTGQARKHGRRVMGSPTAKVRTELEDQSDGAPTALGAGVVCERLTQVARYPRRRPIPPNAPNTTDGYRWFGAAAKRSTIAAAGSTSVIAPTPWPAYIAIASTSPSIPASGRLAA